MPFTSPHPHFTIPPCWGTHSAKHQFPPQCCLSPRLSLALKPPHCLAFLDIRTPQVPPVMHLYFPVHCGCLAALHIPAVPQGHLSPCTVLVTSEPCTSLWPQLQQSPQSRVMAPHVLFLPQNTPIVLKSAAGAAGPGATKNPHLTFSFWFFPFFFPVFLVLQVSATAIPQQTNLPAPAGSVGSGAWARLGAGG